ncbi:MAG: hypothetical protein J6V60_02495, partial [Muribaculaceae bacterium]|nr:hypothetical protein [Muribaculaceae bacterium]
LSAGRLRSLDELPVKTPDGGREQMYYSNENDDFILWADVDSAMNTRLYEASRLNDGTWHEPVMVDFGDDRSNHDDYPCMMSDGSTLYIASQGEGSIGGYDIFCSNRDSQTHEYMSPLNVGMPYNSPYNDFMLAIDEENGIGWWATDRHTRSGDSDQSTVTIYVFIPNDVRVNRHIDDPDIVSYAKMTDYKMTWEEDADYSEILQTISEIDVDHKVVAAEFEFPISSEVVYRNYDDFKTHEGTELMRDYLAKTEALNDLTEELSKLRKSYHSNPSAAVVAEIKSVKAQMQSLMSEIKEIRNNIYKAEKSTR